MFYSDLESGRFYQLRLRKSSGLSLLKGWEERLSGTANAKVELKANVWYSFKIRAQGEKGATRIRAKLWAADASEPHGWAIDATDRHRALSSGTIGMMASEEGV